jgi:hypothetical protein
MGGAEGGGSHHLRRRGGGTAEGSSSITSGSAGGGGSMMILGGGGPDEPMLDTSYRSAPQLSSASTLLPSPLGMAVAPTTEAAAVDPETSLHTLTESLDEDAISFITSMKYS